MTGPIRSMMTDKEIIAVLDTLKKTVKMSDKDEIRKFYSVAREEMIQLNRAFLETVGSRIIDKYFANGKDIDPYKIEPVLIPVENTETSDIFKTARFYWSIPYTEGFGRRLKFIVMDKTNNKLIGILGLQSPVIGLEARNKWIGFEEGRDMTKIEALNETMDIYTLGAVPPYNYLLGGKLMVLTAVAKEIRELYKQKYAGTKTCISGRVDKGELVLLTTTSAFGKSSIYNRVKFKEHTVCIPVGYTKGMGYSYIPHHVFELARTYLAKKGLTVKSAYGEGPNYRFRLLSKFLSELKKEGILLSQEDVFFQGYQKEVYVFPLAKNAREYLLRKTEKPEYYNWSFSELAEYWKQRYLMGRITRNSEWKTWNKNALRDDLLKKYQLSFDMCL